MSLESFETKDSQSSNSLWGYWQQTFNRPWMGIYLRVLSIIVAYSALVHGANLAGFGEKPWSDMPLTWKVGDIVYAIVDTVAAIGLWKRTVWGVVCMLVGVLSQFIIYTVFIEYFAFTSQQRQTINILLVEEVVLLLVFLVLLIGKK
ncbi:MAG: hypothetical protein F6K16_15740 [Symploca sp. SIO2B6]|nr:hypothetical protein [Symploca sp. SIO2B6]